MIISISIDNKRLADVLQSAFTGINYWCLRIDSAGLVSPAARPVSVRALLEVEQSWHLVEREPSGKMIAPMSYQRLTKGMSILAAKYPHHLAAILSNKHDQETADALVQCAVFGELVYG